MCLCLHLLQWVFYLPIPLSFICSSIQITKIDASRRAHSKIQLFKDILLHFINYCFESINLHRCALVSRLKNIHSQQNIASNHVPHMVLEMTGKNLNAVSSIAASPFKKNFIVSNPITNYVAIVHVNHTSNACDV